MLLRFFYDDNLAQASYLVGCPACGEALIIDPARDIRPYLAMAESKGLRIVGVAETHIHADFASGGHELAAATGATLYLSGHGGEYGYQFAHDDVQVQTVCEGDVIEVGAVRLDVMHTPGHTPEHIVFQVTDRDHERPLGIFSGDCLFVGDMGRPDLLETAAGITNSKEEGARHQFASMRHLRELPDYLQVWPGHGAGSACGKALGDLPASTIGYERLVNPAFQHNDEDAFVEWLLSGQPETPRYFGQMKRINQRGVDLLSTLKPPQPVMDPKRAQAIAHEHLLIDPRDRYTFARGHIPGAVNVPANHTQFASWAGWYVDYDAPTCLIAEPDALPGLLSRLRAIGIDNIPVYISAQVASFDAQVEMVDVHDAQQRQQDGALILDVRSKRERDEDYIPGSQYIHMGHVTEQADALPRDREIIVQCGAGVRSQIVVSLLQRMGFEDVVNLDGGIDGWKKAGLPITSA